MATGIINGGVCGFTIKVNATSEDRQNVKLKIISDCPNYKRIAEKLTEVDVYK